MSQSPALRRCVVILFSLLAPICLANMQDAGEIDEAAWWESIAAIHLEQPTDAWAPGAGNSDRNGPSTVQFGRFVSVQVNVNAGGANIVGDAANEPSIAVSPTQPNQIVIGWRQFDTVDSNFRQAGWAYSHDTGATWTFPGVLEPGVFRSDPVLACDAEGGFHYLSLRGDFTTWLYSSDDGGQTWAEPVFAWGGDKQWFAIDRTDRPSRGRMYQAWSRAASSVPSAVFNWSSDGGATWEYPVDVNGRPIWGTPAVDRSGIVYVPGYLSSSGSTIRVSVSESLRDAAPGGGGNPFEHQYDLDLGGTVIFGREENPAGLMGQLGLDVDRSNGPYADNVYLVATLDPPTDDPGDVNFRRSEDRGATWAPVVRVNDDPDGSGVLQWFGTMSVAPNGRIDVVWIDQRNRSGDLNAQVFYSYSRDAGGTWSPNVPLTPLFDTHIGWPQQEKIGDYYHMVSEAHGAHLAYAATFNGEQDVYYVFIESPECNADLDGSGSVDLGDLALLLGAFGFDDGGDLDGDGITGLTDLAEMLSLFGDACG